MGHPQPATTMHTDSSTAYGVLNNNVHQKFTKYMDMCFYCAQDRISAKITTIMGNLALLVWNNVPPNTIRLIIISERTNYIYTVR